MDENHQGKTRSKLIATENNIWLPPLPPKEQKKVEQLQKGRKKAKQPLGIIGISAAFVGLVGVMVLFYFAWFSFQWSWWVLISLILAGIILSILIRVGYATQWTGFKDKTLWSWLQLLIVSLVLAVGGFIYGAWQHAADQQRAQDQRQATILQTYIDNVHDLMLEHNLLKSKPDGDAAILARAQTLSALQGLDPERKGRLLTFLHEAKLIGFIDPIDPNLYDPPIINLYGADLRGAKLGEADLSGADLSGTILSGATLSGATLAFADLREANLGEANLSGADLHRANLIEAKLREAILYQAFLDHANLTYADLSKADLREAILYQAFLYRTILYHADLTYADLSKADLTGAILTGAKRSPAAEITSFVGTWQNVDPNTSSWIRIKITAQGNTLTAHFWGQCYPTPCDAGSTSAPFKGNPVHLYIDSGFAVRDHTLILVGDTLQVTTFTHFTDNSGRPDYTFRGEFRR